MESAISIFGLISLWVFLISIFVWFIIIIDFVVEWENDRCN
jgi:hypothetical protein